MPVEYGILKDERFAEVDIELLRPNPNQPRMRFNQDSIDELAQSIKESGVLQPIVVVPEEDHYTIIIGERRWRACQKIGLKKAPVLIRTLQKDKQIEASLIENLQREDLNPLEIALAYNKIIQELSFTQEEVAARVGKDRTSVANYVRLLKLPEEIQQFLVEGNLSMGHARALITVDDAPAQRDMARQIVKKDLSVRDAERMIARWKKRKTPQPKPDSDPDLMALQEDLVKALGTKVSISGNRKKGVIKIHYYSLDELNRVHDHIKGEPR